MASRLSRLWFSWRATSVRVQIPSRAHNVQISRDRLTGDVSSPQARNSRNLDEFPASAANGVLCEIQSLKVLGSKPPPRYCDHCPKQGSAATTPFGVWITQLPEQLQSRSGSACSKNRLNSMTPLSPTVITGVTSGVMQHRLPLQHSQSHSLSRPLSYSPFSLFACLDQMGADFGYNSDKDAYACQHVEDGEDLARGRRWREVAITHRR